MKALLTIITFLFVTQAFGQSNTASEITALSKKRVQWLLEGKIDSLGTLYDQNSITVHSNGMIKSTLEHFEDIKNGRPVYKSIDVKDATVKEFGNTAVLVGQRRLQDFHERAGYELQYGIYRGIY